MEKDILVLEVDTKGDKNCETFKDFFMLRTPEPVKKDIKFGVFKLGKIRGNLSRKDIYEDR